jgi:hypothetical protein
MFTDVSEACTFSINSAMMMEAVRTSETSVNIYLTTGQYIPEDSKLHAIQPLSSISLNSLFANHPVT